uniref:Chemokine interleukin-8-like domain-containing protein n=1 Tax=Amphilophus citrinellus TaxID=61819 RepID=A0A3Q0QRN2_AMPCI
MNAVINISLFLPAQGPNESSPGECCFKFFTGRVPAKKIISITKTHRSCLEKAFVLNTQPQDEKTARCLRWHSFAPQKVERMDFQNY